MCIRDSSQTTRSTMRPSAEIGSKPACESAARFAGAVDIHVTDVREGGTQCTSNPETARIRTNGAWNPVLFTHSLHPGFDLSMANASDHGLVIESHPVLLATSCPSFANRRGTPPFSGLTTRTASPWAGTSLSCDSHTRVSPGSSLVSFQSVGHVLPTCDRLTAPSSTFQS